VLNSPEDTLSSDILGFLSLLNTITAATVHTDHSSVEVPDKRSQRHEDLKPANIYLEILLSLESLASALFAGRYNKHLETSSDCWGMESRTIQDVCTTWLSPDVNNLLGSWEGRPSCVGVAACAGYTAATAAFYQLHRNDRYQDHSILLGMTCGIVFGLGTGKTLQTTILSILPWLVTLSLVLSSAAHRVMQHHSKDGEVQWYCCQCGDSSARCRTPVGCVICSHPRCDSCSISEH
jgi:hypothetical protein